jgi:cell fate regulator YaaT (PSP1 superfamily)
MPMIVGVRFKPATKVYYFDPAGFEDLKAGEYIIVETARGQEAGKVVIAPSEVSDQEIVGQLKQVARRATAIDLSQMIHYQVREQDAVSRCRAKVLEHGLPMKVVRAEYNYDGSRLLFFFTAEKRVDFRKLVQDLARSFRARIELRQIGVRDEAKLIGGVGKCGRCLCCVSWLADFEPVSIKMAKQQDLPLSPMEISGTCGRLLCCLSYENDHYAQMRQKLPRVGSFVDTARGRGKVVEVNVIQETVRVELEGQVFLDVPRDELGAPRTAERPERAATVPEKPAGWVDRPPDRSEKPRRRRRARPRS